LKKNKPFVIIKRSLILAILLNKPEIFKYYLLSHNIETTFPDTLRFYKFFKGMLKDAYATSKGKLHLRIENPKWDNEGYTHFCFYDNYHLHNRINVRIKEINEKLHFDMLPF
jgi:hypothetical protein